MLMHFLRAFSSNERSSIHKKLTAEVQKNRIETNTSTVLLTARKKKKQNCECMIKAESTTKKKNQSLKLGAVG